MPPYNGVTVSGAQIELITTVGNAENVSLEVDAAAVATIGNIRELRDNLGAVEIRFEETTSAERENIRSQDTLGKIFGKVRKYFEDLKAVAFSGRYSDLSGTPEIGNVDNTSDMDKPVSTAQQQALATQYQQLTGYTDQKIADLIGGAPETLDTLKEVADAIEENESVVTALDAAIGRKADQTALDDHTGNNTIHVTADDKAELAALRGDVTEINSNIDSVNQKIDSAFETIGNIYTASVSMTCSASSSHQVLKYNLPVGKYVAIIWTNDPFGGSDKFSHLQVSASNISVWGAGQRGRYFSELQGTYILDVHDASNNIKVGAYHTAAVSVTFQGCFFKVA